MKYLKVYPEKCVGCHACEEACSEMFFKEKNIKKSCIQITENAQDSNYNISVCSQCQKCMPMCQPEAITANQFGVVMINKKNCIGCLICVAECPTRVMFYHESEKTPFKCIACGVCATKCPTNALELVKE